MSIRLSRRNVLTSLVAGGFVARTGLVQFA